MLRKLILTAAAAALVGAPLTAQAASARMASPVAETEDLNQGVGAILGIAFFTVLILLLSSDSDLPDSP